MAAIDWTPAVLTNMNGLVEYRVEVDGLVRWRGNVVFTGVAYPTVTIPVEARAAAPFPYPLLWDWGTRFIYVLEATIIPQYVGPWTPGTGISLAGIVWQGVPPVPTLDNAWTTVIDGLATVLADIDGLRFYGYPVERIEPPACVVALPEPTALTCGDGSFSYEFPLWVLVAKADARAANDELSPYIEPNGERSIRSAIAADRTLNGACDSVAILSVVPQVVTLAGTEFFAAEFTLEVVG